MTYLQPVFPILLFLAAVALIRRWRASAPHKPRLLALALGGLFLVSWPPMAWLLSRPLEAVYPPREYPADTGDAIVVLASAVYPPCPPIPTPRLGSDTYERCQYAAWLHTHWRPLPVLACGGTEAQDIPPYAITMREALEREGVPASAIWLEQRSHSTHENALYGAELLRRKGIRKIILVTDAYHMLRAAECFRREGMIVVPAACGYRTYQGFHPAVLLPGWEPIAWNEDVAHESLGLLWYWIRGWV
jgi:uncharacterized SAM-binding protein YcdF (DUF218 family)